MPYITVKPEEEREVLIDEQLRTKAVADIADMREMMKERVYTESKLYQAMSAMFTDRHLWATGKQESFCKELYRFRIGGYLNEALVEYALCDD